MNTRRHDIIVSMKTILFVYGSLKKNKARHRLIEGQKFIGISETKPIYRLYNNGTFPVMVEDEKNGISIKGELWEIEENCLNFLDFVEVHPWYFKRTEIQLSDGFIVQAYLFQESVDKLEDCGEVWE